jgi:hypothetical protein
MTSSPWISRGLFRVKGDPTLVQVQLGQFSRLFTERDYQAGGYRPRLEKLPWKGGREASFSPYKSQRQ